MRVLVHDGMRALQAQTTTNGPQVTSTRGTDLSGSMEGAGGIGGLLGRSHGYFAGNWSTHNYYHADDNGNVTYLVNSSQTRSASYRYDPYGNANIASELFSYLGGIPNTYRFSSKEVHLLTGLYYYGYRWYAPNVQRWLNRDPKRELGFELLRKGRLQINPIWIKLYNFVHNNPVTLLDAKGLSTGPFDGNCCNQGTQNEWALVDWDWRLLTPGACTDEDLTIVDMDCDGMTCYGGFYAVGDFSSIDCKPGKNGAKCNQKPENRWTPNNPGNKSTPPGAPARPGRPGADHRGARTGHGPLRVTHRIQVPHLSKTTR